MKICSRKKNKNENLLSSSGQEDRLHQTPRATMSGMFQRVIQYLADQIIVKNLAQSKTFQNAAMKTHQGGRTEAEHVLSKVKDPDGERAGL
jgi:hypothetical protein